MLKFFYCSLLLLSISFFVSSQEDTRNYLADPKAGARNKNIDIIHSLIEVSFEPTKGLVKGTVSHKFIPLQKEVDSLFFDGTDMVFKKVLLNNKPVPFENKSNGIIIRPEQSLSWETNHTVIIEYEAEPRKGLYFIGWNDTKNLSRKQIWTQGQGIDNRYWFPTHDDMYDKMITEVKITFDENYRVLSNGKLISEKILPDGNKLWHYKITHPQAPYLVMIGIGKYDIRKYNSKGGVEIDCWYYPEYPDRVQPTYRYSAEMMDWMENEFGVPYPWSKYSQLPVQDFMYGAMENTTATIFGDFYFMDERAFIDRDYIGTNAHELTHQWFGDYITARSGEHMWLQESFATHYQKHFEKSIFGEDYYQWNRRLELQRVIAAAERDRNPIVHTKAGGERIYPKGSLVLDMLEYVVGKEQFKKVVTYYLNEHAYDFVDTHDFYLAFLETLGINLDWFFEEWLYHGGEPHYVVSYHDNKRKDGKHYTDIYVKQTHEINNLVGLFTMPISFEVHYTDGTQSSVQETINDHSHLVSIPNPENKTIEYVLFDPNSEIIKTVDFNKDIEELKAQAMKAKGVTDRFDALKGLVQFPFHEKKDFLIDAYNRETFYANRLEIVHQLMNESDSLPAKLIRKMLNDKNATVREAAVDKIKTIPQPLLPDFEKLLTDSSYYVVKTTLIKLTEQYPANTEEYLRITKDVEGSGNAVKAKWLEIATSIDKEKYLPQLVALTSQSYEFRTRINAMEILKRFNYLDKDLMKNLFDAALNPNRRLANPAKSLIKHFKIQADFEKLMNEYYKANEWEAWENEILTEIL